MRIPGSLRRIVEPSASLVGGTIDLTDLMSARCGGDEDVVRYEKALAGYLGVDDVITYNSGRTALHEILCALGVGEGDEVITPGFTCIAVPAAIVATGATPIYADLLPGSCNVDADVVATLVTSRTRAVIAQHTFGIPCDLDALKEIARRCGAILIEDCAHALGATYKGAFCGAIGDVGFFSSEHTKMISTGKGGGIIVGKGALRDRLRARHETLEQESREVVDVIMQECALDTIRGAPRTGGVASIAIRVMGERYARSVDAYNAAYVVAQKAGDLWAPRRLSGRQAVLGRLQVERLEADVDARVLAARRLETLASSLGWWTFGVDWAQTRPSFVRYPFSVDNRTGWISELRSFGLEPGFWFTDPIHPTGSSREKARYTQGSCPHAEELCGRILNIPLNAKISNWIADRVRRLGALATTGNSSLAFLEEHIGA